MKRESFIKHLIEATDRELYLLAKKYIIHEQIGFTHNIWKSEAVLQECERRNPKIYDDALYDALYTIKSLEEKMLGLKVVEIKRIDYLSKHELINYVELLPQAGKRSPTLDLENTEPMDIAKAFGLGRHTVFCRVSGSSMQDAKIFNGDTVIVDTSLKPKNGNIVLVRLNGGLFIKRLKISKSAMWLVSENEDFEDVKIEADFDFKVIGVVKNSIRSHLR